MSDPKFPPAPRLPSIPEPPPGRAHELSDTAPPADDLFADIVELKGALTNVGDLVTRLTTRLARLQLTMLSNARESKQALDLAREAVDRLGKVESDLAALAAE